MESLNHCVRTNVDDAAFFNALAVAPKSSSSSIRISAFSVLRSTMSNLNLAHALLKISNRRFPTRRKQTGRDDDERSAIRSTIFGRMKKRNESRLFFFAIRRCSLVNALSDVASFPLNFKRKNERERYIPIGNRMLLVNRVSVFLKKTRKTIYNNVSAQTAFSHCNRYAHKTHTHTHTRKSKERSHGMNTCSSDRNVSTSVHTSSITVKPGIITVYRYR